MSGLFRTDYMLKHLKKTWKFWDDTCMGICKQHDGYSFNLYIAIDNKLILSEIHPNTVAEDLKKIEENRIFKLKKIILPEL